MKTMSCFVLCDGLDVIKWYTFKLQKSIFQFFLKVITHKVKNLRTSAYSRVMKLFSLLFLCFLVSRHYHHHIDAKSIALADYPEIKDHLDEFLSIEQDLADELNEKSERLEELETEKRTAINSKIHLTRARAFFGLFIVKF